MGEVLVKMDHDFTFFFFFLSGNISSQAFCVEQHNPELQVPWIKALIFFFFLCISAFMHVITVASHRYLELFNVIEMRPSAS